MPALQAIFLVFLLAAFGSATGGKVDAEQAVPPMALYGKEGFDRVAHEMSRIEDACQQKCRTIHCSFQL